MSFFRSLVDLVFPPICVSCKEVTQLKYLCENCWLQSSLLDLNGRCTHCFDEIEEGVLCARCARNPLLPFQRAAVFDRQSPIFEVLNPDHAIAAASFAYYQWLKLDWAEPDLIISIPPDKSKVCRAFSDLCSKPNPKLFRRIAWPLQTEKWEVFEPLIEEHSTVLLFDEGASLKQLQLATTALSAAFPKKVYLISLFL